MSLDAPLALLLFGFGRGGWRRAPCRRRDERSTLMRTFSCTSSVTVLSVRPEIVPMTPPEVTTSSPFLSDLSHESCSFCFFCCGRIRMK